MKASAAHGVRGVARAAARRGAVRHPAGVRFAPAAIECRSLPGGGLELVSPVELPSPLPTINDKLRHWTQAAPGRVLIAEPAPTGWRTLTYGEAESVAATIGDDLLGHGLSPDRPILIAAPASRAHGALRLAALRAGIPFVPVSPAALRFADAARLRAIVAQMTPGLIAAAPDAIAAIPADIRGALPLLTLDDALLDNAARDKSSARLDAAERAVTPDTLAAIFLTSGSTGTPKGVAVTHRMIAANQAAYAGAWPFLDAAPPVILDWLPWHHTFGGNDNIHKALWFGGSYYIDDGAPTPERFARTLANIRDVAPSIHLNVPRGLALLVERLEADEALFRRFFERLELIFCGGAGIDAETWRRLQALVARAGEINGRTASFVTGYGTTEAGSTICLVHFPVEAPHVVGLPIPGLTMRLIPAGEKLEVRVKGAMVTPGYWRDGAQTAAAFDADGFFRTGDAARFVDPREPARGLLFDGRLGEDFKLSSGTWVSVGPLRQALLTALTPLASEVLIAGRDRDRVGLVVFLDVAACAAKFGGTPDARRLAADPGLRAGLAAALARHNAGSPGSSTAISRAVIDPEPPSVSAGEVSDKGSLNQRLALANRAALVETLFADPPSPDVIVPQQACERP